MLLSASLLSCSLILLDRDTSKQNDETSAPKDNLKVIVNGVVSDIASNSIITGIKITFSAYTDDTTADPPLVTKTVYTDSNGIYTVEADGFSDSITCIITAESTSQNQTQYETVTNKVVVTWSGSSFNPEENTFFANECNFQMKQK
jgi:hypothetical protein